MKRKKLYNCIGCLPRCVLDRRAAHMKRVSDRVRYSVAVKELKILEKQLFPVSEKSVKEVWDFWLTPIRWRIP